MNEQPKVPAAPAALEPKKQFIVGASCPACERMDSVRMWFVDGVPHRECVACGYSDKLDESSGAITLVAVDEKDDS